MYRKKRSYTRRYAGKKNGRNYFWIRLENFALTSRDTADGVYGDYVLSEDNYQNPSAGLNETRKGGPRLERMFGHLSFAAQVEGSFIDSNPEMLCDCMVFTQTDQFVFSIGDTAGFDTTLANQRILSFGTARFNGMVVSPGSVNDTVIQRVRYDFDIKSKARLAEMSIGVALRANFDLANLGNSLASCQTTMLVSTP